MACLMGIDVGTSSTKVLIMNREGKALSFESSSYDISTPMAGYAEQDASLLRQHTLDAMKRAVAKSGCREIACIGVTGQMHGLVTLDAEGSPVRPLVIWADQRSHKEVELLKKLDVEKVAFNPPCTGFALSSLLWIKENEKEAYSRTRHILQPKDYIIYMLTGSISTELSDASGTLMLDALNERWNEGLLDELGLDASMLPPLSHSLSRAGFLKKDLLSQLGLKGDVPVIHGGGDTLMQLVGNGVVRKGQLCTNIGTASQICCVTESGRWQSEGNLNNFHHVLEDDSWVTCGASLNGGIILKWCRDLFFGTSVKYSDMDRIAEKSAPGAGGIVTLPFICGERSPYLDEKARGIIFGLSLTNTPSDFIRSLLESVVFSFRDCMRFFDLPASDECIIASGGGAKSRIWLQIQADVLKRPVKTTSSAAEAASGAAICAGVAAGIWPSVAEACHEVVTFSDEIIEPNEKNFDLYDERFDTYLGLYRNNRELFWK